MTVAYAILVLLILGVVALGAGSLVLLVKLLISTGPPPRLPADVPAVKET